MKKWIDKIQEKYRIESRVRWLVIKGKTTTLPFFDDVPIYDVLHFIYEEIKNDDIITRANSMAYSFFIALFPFLLVMLSVIYFLPYDFDVDGYIDSLPEVIPQEIRSTIERMVIDVLQVPRGGLLSIGFVLALYFSSNGMITLMKGFDKAYEHTFVTRSFLQSRLVAIKLTLLMGVLFLASLIFIVFGDLILSQIIGPEFPILQYYLILLIKWLGVIILYFGGISTIYYFGPSLKTKFRFFSAGATMATVLSLIISYVFSLYIDNFGQYSEIYGSIGAIIIILLWLQLNCLIVLLGFELNASIRVNKDLRALDK